MIYAFHILTQQAANGGQNDKKKKCTFHTITFKKLDN